MKILILYPELEGFNHKHLGISLLSGHLKQGGHEIEFFDTSMFNQISILPDRSLKEKKLTLPYWFPRARVSLPRPTTLHIDVIEAFNRKLHDFSPELILISTTFFSFKLGANLINLSDAKSSLNIFGGIHCTVSPESAINYENVKYIHLGEAELSLPILLEKIKKHEPLDQCPNIWCKKDDGGISKNEILPLLNDLDTLPYYDWDLYKDDYYFNRIYQGNIYRMGDFAISRGCYNHCSYCFNKQLFDRYGVRKFYIRYYTVDRAIEELAYLKEKYKINFIKFHDSDFFNKPEEYLEEFSKKYRKYVNVPNTTNACIAHVTEGKARALIRMNCQSISIGLESGNEMIRNKILNRQTCSNETFLKKINILKGVGLRVSLPAMFGVPEETQETIFETIELVRKSKADHADFGLFFPFPNLPLTEYAIKHGFLDQDRSLENVAFGLESPLKLSMSQEEIRGLLNCSMLYMRLPKILWPIIKLAEKDSENNLLWHFLRKLYFIKLHYFDFSKMFRRLKRKKSFKSLVD